jgi:hypothetical protein
LVEDRVDGSNNLISWKSRIQRDEYIKEESFLFISTLLGTVPIENDIWLIESGAPRHMTDYRDHLSGLVDKETSLHVILGDNAKYNVKGV